MEHKLNYLKTMLLFTCSLFLVSCSLNEGEPRVTLCQKVVYVLLDEPKIDWLQYSEETEAYSQITVSLLFDVQDQAENKEHTDTLSAVCIYAYNDIAEYETLDREYENTPTDVFINDKMVDRYTLTKAANAVMAGTIKGLFTK